MRYLLTCSEHLVNNQKEIYNRWEGHESVSYTPSVHRKLMISRHIDTHRAQSTFKLPFDLPLQTYQLRPIKLNADCYSYHTSNKRIHTYKMCHKIQLYCPSCFAIMLDTTKHCLLSTKAGNNALLYWESPTPHVSHDVSTTLSNRGSIS